MARVISAHSFGGILLKPQLMAANGWETSDKCTCVSGTDQGVPQVGEVCFFVKHSSGKQIGLIILASLTTSSTPTIIRRSPTRRAQQRRAMR